MAYKNIAGVFGHKWVTQYDIDTILKEFPESRYSTWVTFTDGKSDMPLRECTGTERNIDTLVISYKDGTNTPDPDPYVKIIVEPLDATRMLNDLPDANPISHFFKRAKGDMFPSTRNEQPSVINSVRTVVRAKFKHFVHMDGMEDPRFSHDGATMRIPVNCFDSDGRKNLLRFLEHLDKDGILTFVEVKFDCASLDQLERVDTEIEFGDTFDVVDMVEGKEDD